MPPCLHERLLFRLIAVLVILLWTPVASAHFKLNLNVRILHVEHLQDGLQVYLRMPMSYLVAGELGPEQPDGLPLPAPFTSNRIEQGQLMHLVDFRQISDNPDAFAALIETGWIFSVANDRRIRADIQQIRLYRVGSEPSFATLAEAKTAFLPLVQSLEIQSSDMSEPAASVPIISPNTVSEPLYVGDAVVDALLLYRTGRAVFSYSVASRHNPGLPGQEDTANLLLNYGIGAPGIYRARGLMEHPLQVSPSLLSAWTGFIVEGIRHIIEGLDHLLFVICLVLGAQRLKLLLWRATGFTVGHSLTLALGFFGFVPSGDWFVPAVEIGIALSIIIAAGLAIGTSSGASTNSGGSAIPKARAEAGIVLLTAAIGLLHGLGFSFMLSEILRIDSPSLWQSLLAFNLGVEFGQLSVILLVWPVLQIMRQSNIWLWRSLPRIIAMGCIGVAAIWSIERILKLAPVF